MSTTLNDWCQLTSGLVTLTDSKGAVWTTEIANVTAQDTVVVVEQDSHFNSDNFTAEVTYHAGAVSAKDSVQYNWNIRDCPFCCKADINTTSSFLSDSLSLVDIVQFYNYSASVLCGTA